MQNENNRLRRTALESSQDIPRVVCRVLILAAVVCRGSIDSNAAEPEVRSLHSRLLEWLTQLDLWADAEPSEAKILHTPLGELERNDVIQATWSVEGLTILAWALQQCGLPRQDEEVDPIAVTDSVWFLSEDARERLLTASLRNRRSLQAARELLYAIHVRLRDFMRHRESKNIVHWIEKEWTDALKLNVTDLIAGHDLAIDDKPLSEVEYQRVEGCAHLAFQRYKAIVWLVEGHPVYSQTPVDT